MKMSYFLYKSLTIYKVPEKEIWTIYDVIIDLTLKRPCNHLLDIGFDIVKITLNVSLYFNNSWLIKNLCECIDR